MADERIAGESPRLDVGTQIAVELFELVVLGLAPAAVAVAALIDRDDVKAVSEPAAEIVPDVRVKPAAVNHDDCVLAFIAPVEMVQRERLAVDEMAAR